MKLYTGVVENRDDPLRIGRCQVRIVGLHTEDKTKLPTEDLPWAHPIAPITSASMNGIGWTPVGPVLGTWVMIVFTDTDEQYPVMLGTLPGIPQSQAAQIASEESSSDAIATDGGILVDSTGTEIKNSSGDPVQVGTKDSQSSPPTTAPSSTGAAQPNLSEQNTPNAVPDSTLKTDIPTTPPPNSTSNTTQATASIKAIIAACDKVGLTSKYAKCAVIAIAGGESAWLPVPEGFYYSKAESLASVFKGVFKGDLTLAAQYTKWQGSREDFFRFIYSPNFSNGYSAGNRQPDDGALFYGRGFIQFTGRALYQQLETALGKSGIVAPLTTQPDLLITDVNICAAATAMFFKLNVKVDQNDPGYFVAARKRTGNDAGGGYAKKQKYYDYFLGGSTTVDSTNKPTADAQVTYSPADVAGLPPAKQAALLENRSGNKTIGFTDPTGKYPLRNLLDEPDTNRLSRGIQKETAIEFKDSQRSKGIPSANGGDTWDQPLAPFGGEYPYAKVMETESGHLLTFDDTPLNETVGMYHKTGTFTDIDANGTQVNKIIGDGYTIIDRNGSVYINGRCVITVGNSASVYVQGSADVQVDGAATVNLNNDASIGVAGDLDLAVGGDFNVLTNGSFNLKSNANIQMDAAQTNIQTAGTAFTLASGTTFALESATDMFMKAAGNQHIKSAGNTFLNTAGTHNILAGQNINIDGAQFHGQEGAAQAATDAPGYEEVVVELTPPDYITGASDSFTYLTTPVRPSPPVIQKYAISQDNENLVNDYIANPSKYNNPDAAAGGVKPNYAGTPKDDGQGQSLKANGTTNDISIFLQKQLELAATGYWSETGMGGGVSNANIIRIWADLGYPKSGIWMTDQTAWCMGFVNWVLKQCGYRYVQTASAAEITTNPQRWGATQITNLADAQPGDIAFWRYRHVNFVYTSVNGKLTFVGGNQADRAANNPSGGTVNQSWAGGYKVPGDGSLVSIWRPTTT